MENLKLLSEKELKEFEPYVNGIKGIHVPQTGIIDYAEVSRKLKEILINKGAEFKFNEEVTDIKLSDEKVEVITKGSLFSGGFAVSCAGLQSDRIAKMTNPDLPLRIIPFRGEYYKLKKEKELKKKQELLSLRLKSIETQEKDLSKQAEDLKKEVMKKIK